MSDLHPAARALIDAAKRGEGSLPSATRARVHRSVLRRAVALGAAATTSTASVATKAAALAAALTSPLAVPGVIAAVAGVAFFVLHASVTPSNPEGSRGAGPPAPMHIVASGAPRAVAPSIERTPAIALPGSSAASQETPPSARVAPDLVAVPRAKPPAVSAPPPPATIPRGRPESPADLAPRPAAEAIEAPDVVTTAEEASRSPAAAATSAPAVTTLTPAVDLAADLDLLRQVHAALRGGRPEAALSLLDRAGRGLEGGPLAEEAQAARVSALCQLGRVADARAATDRFLVSWPSSPLATRLRAGCAAVGAHTRAGAD
jgi:hypothetical protein